MTIDIILVCYNQEQYIRQALDSILMQEMPENTKMRLIVADDNSIDNTLWIIQEMHDTQCKVHDCFEWAFLPQEPNMGISKNYQRSFAATQGEYVFILEGDDYWLPGHIQQHVAFLGEHPECSMSFNMLRILEDSTGKMHDWIQKEPYQLVSLQQQIEGGNHLGNLSGCCFRGDALRSLPGNLYNIPFADWMLGVMMAEIGNIALLSDVTNVYRVKDSGVWAGMSNWQQHKTLIEYANMYDHYQDYKYHQEWSTFKSKQWNHVRSSWMHYIPAGLRDFIHKFTKR